MVMGMNSIAFGFELNGQETPGVQIDDVFYPMDYIATHPDEFADVFGNADPTKVIIDLNEKPIKFSDYAGAGYPADFDGWASNPSNQTVPNPQKYIGSDGSQNPIGEPEQDEKITEAKAVATVITTEVSGKYASDVTKIEVIYDNMTKEAVKNDDGTFKWSIFGTKPNGTKIVIKGYIGNDLVDTDTVTVGDEVQEKEFKVIDIF
jgi:hypothetical protein